MIFIFQIYMVCIIPPFKSCLKVRSVITKPHQGLAGQSANRCHFSSRLWFTLFSIQGGWFVYLSVSSSSRSPPLPILTHHQLGGFLIHLLVDHLVKLLVHHHPHDHLHLHISPFGLPNCTFSWLLSTWGWVAPSHLGWSDHQSFSEAGDYTLITHFFTTF